MYGLENNHLLDINQTIAKELFTKEKFAWEIIPKIGEYILELGKTLPKDKFNKIEPNIWIAKNAKIAPTSCIIGPCIIDEESEIRHAAFIRGNVIIGKSVVVRKFNRA